MPLILSVWMAGAVWAADAGKAEPEYPLLLAFRTGQGLKTEADYAPYALFDFVHAGGDRELIRKFNPDAPCVSHWRQGVAYKPGAKKPKSADIKWALGQSLWPGYWLLYNGTKIIGDLPADAAAVTIRVEDAGVFQAPSESPKEFGPDDIQLYALDDNGKPIWERAEQVRLQSLDPAAKTLTVERGQYLSKPLAFKAGRAVAAVHARTPFLFGPDPDMWRLNFTLHCPRNPDGLTAAEFVGRYMGENARMDNLDGVEFDVGEWSLSSKTVTKTRTYDADNDLEPDNCRFRHEGLGVINEHGLGQVVSIRELRKAVGPDKIIQTDVGMRAYPYLNGVEEEFYPCGQRQDPRVATFRLNSIEYCMARCPFTPKISYLQGKFPTATYNNEPDKQWTDTWTRMGIASALCAGAYYTYNAASTLPGGKGEVGLGFGRFYTWDEYDGGVLHKKHYLGKALGAARPLEGQTGKESALAALEGASPACGRGYMATSAYDKAGDVLRVEVQGQPDQPANGGIVLTLPMKEGVDASEGAAFTLQGEVRAETVYGKIDPSLGGLPAAFCVALGKAEGVARDSAILADAEWRSFSVALRSSGQGGGLCLAFGEEPGAFQFRGLKLLEGNGFVLYRRFENGIALMNGSDKPAAFDLAKIDPERKYQAIQGAITPQINDGRPIQGPVTLEPFDGRVLLATKSDEHRAL